MDITFTTGIIGALILVTGAAWNEPKPPKHPTESIKNWLFAGGGFVLLIYSYLNFLQGGAIFFVILEILVAVSSILMMLDLDDRIDAIILSISGLALIIWSLFLFEGYNTIFFILGLTGVGFGYAFKPGTQRRNIALTSGGALIALFSYIEASWIFFWLNLFFTIFTGFYIMRGLFGQKQIARKQQRSRKIKKRS